MIGKYDHFSHPFFLYYIESKSAVEVVAQKLIKLSKLISLLISQLLIAKWFH
jgi:hypothetical protein